NAAMKKRRTLPAIYFQWLSYEDVRRPDVLYGFPNGLITYPFSSISVPGWFAEGTAQYQRTGWTYDTWDSHRDMVLRVAMLNDSYLSFDEMGTFASKTGLEREQVYNQGFAFTAHLAGQYGESVFREISETLAGPGVFSIDAAIETVTGTAGSELFESWVARQKEFYAGAVKTIRPAPATIIEPDGFLNLYPKVSPDGSTIAYLSNKNLTESRASLYVTDFDSSAADPVTQLGLGAVGFGHSRRFNCGYVYGETPLIERIRSAFSYSPDGQALVFTRNRLTPRGEAYNDLFIYRFDSGYTERLTRGARIHDPAWGPGGEQIAAVQVGRGTANLILVDPADGSVRSLTDYENGEQIYTPAWYPDGDAIYFAFGERHGRSIRKLDLRSGRIDILLNERHLDFRDPFIDSEGLFLYYSADPDGIFNIYRIPVDGGEPEKLTSVVGGAFMPQLRGGNELIYSEYRSGGYKIVSKPLPPPGGVAVSGSYRPLYREVPVGPGAGGNPAGPPTGEDLDIDPLVPPILAKADTGSVEFNLPTVGAADVRILRSYQQEFTKFSFYPVIRFDNYTKLHGSNASLLNAGNFGKLGENLLRDLKLGTYRASRDVIDRVSFFGGALFGIGSRDAAGINDFFNPSRLTDLDRDLFLITEYRGLPFIQRRWSPTLSVELYNLRRNVSDGLSVEEFPCTACLPDTTTVDIAYNIWEANLFLRSKINEYSLVELGIGYTPYEVQTETFFSRELDQTIPSSATEYFRGATFSAAYIFESFHSYPHADTAPLGLRAEFRYAYEPGELLENFEIEDGTLSPVYATVRNHSVELESRYGFRFGDRSTGQVFSRFFSFLNRPDDFFYLDYIGGFTGLRSYPFFAVGGNRTALAQFSYIFPVVTDINRQIGRHTLDKLFIRLFAEAGNGWNGPLETGSNLKSGIGTELRFAFNSYYLYPLKFFISGAYGFNEFDVNLPAEFITESGSNRVTYGRELLLHFGLTFDFNILNHE
ncbi:MAG: hypothetical protein R3224_01865, partial [Balneolaceae bacterium]|nr:hypothetical protein [Balneolaceae bacterium]